MDSEENETSCSACREINSDPRRIACGHSFCLKCLQQVAGNNETFPCPICRFDVDLTQTSVDQLLKNVVFCNVIEARDTKQPLICLDHNRSLDLFCQGCDAVICSKCLTMHHKGHAIEDIEIIFIERNKQLGAFLESTKHLASMAQDKSDAVKQSRISMEKNIDSISKTVENTFKKWNDALQKQQNVIFSYLHQERDQKRQVFVEAERILAGSMTTVTGLDTEINKLRCKDTALVVQQYGSIKARQEDTERKVLQEIETCFTPSDNLVLEVYAPWIEEAINNIKHMDMKQTQARPGRQKIAEIQDENVILKRECEKFRNTLQELERETRRLQVENKYLKLILDDLHKSIIVGEATLQMELKPPEDIQNDKLLIELTTNIRKIHFKFYELETELSYIHRTISQLTSMIVGDDRSNDPTQEKTNKFTATGRQPKRNPAMKSEQREQSSKIDKDIELVTSVWRNLKGKEIELSASKQEMENKIKEYEHNYEKLRAEHQKQKTAYTDLYERYNDANAKLSGFEQNMEEKTEKCQQKLAKEAKSRAEILAKLRKTEQDLNEKSVTNTAEIKRLNDWIQYLDSLITNLYDHVVTGAEPTPEGSDQPPESSFAKKYQYIHDIHKKFMNLESENKKYAETNFGLEEILAALDSYCSSNIETKDNLQYALRCSRECERAKQIADRFKEMKIKLSGFEKSMEEKTKEYQKTLVKEEKSKAEIVAKLRKTEQTLNDKSETLKKLQAKHETLQIDHANVNREKSILEDKHRKIQYSISCLQQEKVDMDGKYQCMIEKQNDEITRLRQAEESLLTRLSEIAGDRFTHDNVNIADLRDPDRPTKLSETYSELYDNEWTDAFDELTENMELSDEAAIRFLLQILMNAFHKCKEITWDRYESLKLVASTLDVKQDKLSSMITEEKQPPTANISDGTTTGQHEDQNEGAGPTSSSSTTSEICLQSTSLTSTLSIDQEKSLKNIWRATTIYLKDESLKLLCANLITCLGKPETEMPKTSKYLTCCTELCWKMGVQEKPMHLDVNAEKEIGQEKQFDTDKFRAYTKSGKSVAYVVWPALLLHEGGAMLAKGIAQGCQKRVSSKE